MSDQQFRHEVPQADSTPDEGGQVERRWERERQNIFARLAGVIARMRYGKDHVSAHRRYTHDPKKAREKRRARNAMAKESRKHARPRHTRRA